MALIDNKLTALNRGNPLNSKGSDVATAVNEDIDAIVALLQQGMTNIDDIEALQTLTSSHTSSISTNSTNIDSLETLTTTQTGQITQLQDDMIKSWNDLSGSVSYNTETYYEGSKYLINNPISDVALAPPDRANRNYFEFDGTNDYVDLPTIELQVGDQVRFKAITSDSESTSPRS